MVLFVPIYIIVITASLGISITLSDRVTRCLSAEFYPMWDAKYVHVVSAPMHHYERGVGSDSHSLRMGENNRLCFNCAMLKRSIGFHNRIVWCKDTDFKVLTSVSRIINKIEIALSGFYDLNLNVHDDALRWSFADIHGAQRNSDGHSIIKVNQVASGGDSDPSAFLQSAVSVAQFGLFLDLTQRKESEGSERARNDDAHYLKAKDYPITLGFRWPITIFGIIVFAYFLGQAYFYSGRIAPWILLLGFLCGLAIYNYGLYLIAEFGEYLYQ